MSKKDQRYDDELEDIMNEVDDFEVDDAEAEA